MKQAAEPFQFVAASYLIQICRERARTLGEMAANLRGCSDASIFYHTFQSLESHHYATFSSDFAQWVMAACNEAELAERLGALDLREYVSIADLREAIAGAVQEHIAQSPISADRRAFEPFHFCEAVEVALPIPMQARNLSELEEGIRHISGQSLHHHFINSRLRLRLQTNDFSNWIEKQLGMPELARAVNQLDFYTTTLEGLRNEIIQTLGRWVQR